MLLDTTSAGAAVYMSDPTAGLAGEGLPALLPLSEVGGAPPGASGRSMPQAGLPVLPSSNGAAQLQQAGMVTADGCAQHAGGAGTGGAEGAAAAQPRVLAGLMAAVVTDPAAMRTFTEQLGLAEHIQEAAVNAARFIK